MTLNFKAFIKMRNKNIQNILFIIHTTLCYIEFIKNIRVLYLLANYNILLRCTDSDSQPFRTATDTGDVTSRAYIGL